MAVTSRGVTGAFQPAIHQGGRLYAGSDGSRHLLRIKLTDLSGVKSSQLFFAAGHAEEDQGEGYYRRDDEDYDSYCLSHCCSFAVHFISSVRIP